MLQPVVDQRRGFRPSHRIIAPVALEVAHHPGVKANPVPGAKPGAPPAILTPDVVSRDAAVGGEPQVLQQERDVGAPVGRHRPGPTDDSGELEGLPAHPLQLLTHQNPWPAPIKHWDPGTPLACPITAIIGRVATTPARGKCHRVAWPWAGATRSQGRPAGAENPGCNPTRTRARSAPPLQGVSQRRPPGESPSSVTGMYAPGRPRLARLQAFHQVLPQQWQCQSGAMTMFCGRWSSPAGCCSGLPGTARTTGGPPSSGRLAVGDGEAAPPHHGSRPVIRAGWVHSPAPRPRRPQRRCTRRSGSSGGGPGGHRTAGVHCPSPATLPGPQSCASKGALGLTPRCRPAGGAGAGGMDQDGAGAPLNQQLEKTNDRRAEPTHAHPAGPADG